MRKRKRRTTRPQSPILGRRWLLPDPFNGVWVASANGARVDAVDESWPNSRQLQAAHAHWRWVEIRDRAEDCLALVRREDDKTLALWSTSRAEVQLASKRYYRVDYLEVDPDHIGSGLGAFAMGVICKEASERGLQGVVFGALPSARWFFERLGAKETSLWQSERGLAAMMLAEEAFEDLWRNTDELREKQEEGNAD